MTLASRFAWGLLAVATVIGLRGIWFDVREGAWVGAVVMAVLVGIVVVAGRSLEDARRFFAAQLSEGSALLVERKKQLEVLAVNRVKPDFEVLREATEASLRTRGYLGRYFVAATILVGLVGTFAGIMTTLGDVTPLMNGGAASFRGLDVTFGSSLVAVVITLGLTLLHGEVVGLETAVLSMLDERTAHEWAPALWPTPANTLDEKLDTLASLQGDLIAVLKSTARTAQEERTLQTNALRELQARVDSAQPLLVKTVEHLREHSDRVLDGLSQQLTFLTDELGTRVALLATRVEDSHEKTLAGLGRTATQLSDAQKQSAQEVAHLQLTAAAELAASQKQAASELLEQQLAASASLTKLQLDLVTTQKQAIADLTKLQLEGVTTLTAEQKHSATALAKLALDATTTLAAEQKQSATELAQLALNAATTLAAEQKQSATELAKIARDATTALAAEQKQSATALAELALDAATTLAAKQEQAAAALAKAQLESAEKLAAVLQASTVKLGEAHQASAEGVRELHMAIAKETGLLQKQAADAIVELHRDAINETAKVQRGAATDVANMQLETTLELTKLQRDSLTELSTLQRDAFIELNTLQRDSLTELSQAQHTSAETLRDLQLEATQRQLDATTKAAETAASLAQATTALAPIAQELLPQVRSLAEQIALLATDARDGELDLATFGELERIGNGIEEMRALLDQARGKVAGDA